MALRTEQLRLPAANVVGVRVDAVDMRMAVAAIESAITNKRGGYVCVTGVHGVMESFRDSSLAWVLKNALLVVPDGMPTVWVGRAQGFRGMERVFGPDLMLELMGRPTYSHFLCGGNYGVAEELRHSLLRRFSSVSIVGTYTPPFRKMTPADDTELVAQLAAVRPDIVWVGLSTPKQEQFMARYSPRLSGTVMIGVGAAFDFHTGRIKDSPNWIKRGGLQWCHRLVQEPTRLWKRYLVNNPRFLYQAGMQLLGAKRFDDPCNSAPVVGPDQASHN